MNTIDPDIRKDPTIHRLGGENYRTRIVNVALPFLLMGHLTAQPTSLILSAYQIKNGLYQIKSGKAKEGLLSVAHATCHSALTYFTPALAPLYSTAIQIAMEFRGGLNKEGVARLANHTLFLTSLFLRRPQLLIASLFVQAALEAKESLDEYREGNWIEACGKLALAILRTYAGVGQIQTLYTRETLWQEVEELETGLTREEFETICDYAKEVERSGDPARIKGSEKGLPRSITLANEALYIHLKKKGGMKPLGKGAFKTAYKCLKVEQNHAKLMVELTVRNGIKMAIRETKIAHAVGSPFVNGDAEVVLRYGSKLCLIQELMDVDGWAYSKEASNSPANLLQAMEDIARGLGDLHTFGYTHGDLHPGNVLIKKGAEHHGKLSDLGLACKIKGRQAQVYYDYSHLAELIGMTCESIWSADEQGQAIRAQLMQNFTNPNQDSPTPYEIADMLKEYRISLASTPPV